MGAGEDLLLGRKQFSEEHLSDEKISTAPEATNGYLQASVKVSTSDSGASKHQQSKRKKKHAAETVEINTNIKTVRHNSSVETIDKPGTLSFLDLLCNKF